MKRMQITVSVYEEIKSKSVSIGLVIPLETGSPVMKEVADLIPRAVRSALKAAALRDVFGWELNDEQIRGKCADMMENEYHSVKDRQRVLEGV